MCVERERERERYIERERERDMCMTTRFCASDPVLLRVLRARDLVTPLLSSERGPEQHAWSAAEAVIADFDSVVAEFHAAFRESLAPVGVFLCGHPLVLCRLYYY